MYILNNILSEMKHKKISQKQVLDELGLSSSAFADWKNGKTSSYIKYLPQIAEILGVTEEYLRCDNGSLNGTTAIDKTIYSKTYEREIIASLLSSSELPCDEEILRISSYMGCKLAYLFDPNIEEFIVGNAATDENYELKEHIFEILNTLSTSIEYRKFQVQVSRVILHHLSNDEYSIDSDKLKNELGFTAAKIDFLCSKRIPNMLNTSDVGLNFSDLMKIKREYGISYTYMFTGKN